MANTSGFGMVLYLTLKTCAYCHEEREDVKYNAKLNLNLCSGCRYKFHFLGKENELIKASQPH